MKKVSIIAPMYNVEKYLRKCIDSMINQSLKEIEIILVDDGSPDNSGKIADEYKSIDSRVTVIHKKNGGVSAARNDGLKIAKGEYIIFCDSDDWLDLNACEVLYENAKKNDADISIGDVFMAWEDKNIPVQFYKESFVSDDDNLIKGLIRADLHRTYCENPPAEGPAFGYGGPWNKLVRRNLLIENNIQFDTRTKGVFDDILYSAYILANSKKVCYTTYPMYYYRQVEGSITNSFKPNTLEINEAIFNSWREFFEKYENNEEYQKAFYACVVRRIVESIGLYFVNKDNTLSSKALRKEYIKLIRKEPYHKSLNNVNIAKLNKKQKMVVVLSKCKLIRVLFYIFYRYYKK